MTTELSGPGEVSEDEAEGAVADAYAQLRHVLNVRHVPTLYRMLATHPAFFSAAVEELAPVLARSREDGHAASMRVAAQQALPAPATEPVLDDTGDVAELLDRYNRANPLNLIFALLLMDTELSVAPSVMSPPLPPAARASSVDALLDDIQACHGGFTVPGVWRELFRRPGLAGSAWSSTRSLAEAGHIVTAQQDVLNEAARATEGETAGARLLASQPPDARKQIVETLAWYPTGISTMVAEIEHLKRLLP